LNNISEKNYENLIFWKYLSRRI